MVTGPDLPDATTAIIEVGDNTLNEAASTPPKVIAVTPVKLLPVKVTWVPVVPVIGVNEFIIGPVYVKPVV